MLRGNPKSQISNPQLPRALRPPQFGLRTLLLVVGGCGVFLALGQWLSPLAVLGLLLLIVSIFLHVAGNCLGTRLRDIGDRPSHSEADLAARIVRPQAHEYAPTTQLGERRNLGWIIVIATFVGIIAGGLGGGAWTLLASRGPAGTENIAVGVIAFATLGGLASFAVAAFTQVLLGAIWQALHSSAVPNPRATPDP